MTLKDLAYTAQQRLENSIGAAVKRSHVHELLAAAFGFGSWAAFQSKALLADAGVGDAPAGASPRLVGRALQLGYEQAASVALADAVHAFVTERQLSSVHLCAIAGLLVPPPRAVDDQDAEYDESGISPDADEIPSALAQAALPRDRLLTSALLLDSLDRSSAAAGPHRHFELAALYRCARPRPYLYEESLKGKVLTAIEQGWVADYLRMEPCFQRYERHLRAAALGGISKAAVEYATAFESPEFFELAQRLAGDVDAIQMAKVAPTPQARATWVRTAAEQGSQSALQELAYQGDEWAEDRLAELGDVDAIRAAAERAVAQGNAMRAWTLQYLAVQHGVDFTRSTERAYHDGGPQDGQLYDSDFGGGLYVAGEEALELPAMSRAAHLEAESLARAIHGRAAQTTGQAGR